MINRVVLVGRLTKDPELRYTPNGVAVATFTLAVNRIFANQNGEREADFISCQVWRKTAENVANYLRKGSLIGIEGRIQTRNYENQEGKRVYITEVIADSVQFLEPKGSGQQQRQGFYPDASQEFGTASNFSGQPAYASPQGNYGTRTKQDDSSFMGQNEPIDISDDDLPF